MLQPTSYQQKYSLLATDVRPMVSALLSASSELCCLNVFSDGSQAVSKTTRHIYLCKFPIKKVMFVCNQAYSRLQLFSIHADRACTDDILDPSLTRQEWADFDFGRIGARSCCYQTRIAWFMRGLVCLRFMKVIYCSYLML